MPRYEEAGADRQLRVIAGEGMLVAKVDGTYTDAYGRHEIKAGITRVAPDHPLARQRPDAFRVAWKEDATVMRQHRNNLLARMEELRGYRLSGAGDKEVSAEPAGLAPWPWEKPAWWIG
jgi:hypothetical protein